MKAIDVVPTAMEAPSARQDQIGVAEDSASFLHEHPLPRSSLSRPAPDRAHLQQLPVRHGHESLEELLQDDRLDAVAIFSGAPDMRGTV